MAKKPNGYWNRERCYNEAQKHSTKSEFEHSSPGAYQSARINGWLCEYTWFSKRKAPNRKWYRDKNEAIARTCETKKQFRAIKDAYKAAKNHGWLKDYTWLKDSNATKVKENCDSVYCYKFEDGAIYVGRTLAYRRYNRDWDHRHRLYDSVFRYSQKNNIPVPKMVIIEDNLPVSDGIKKEVYYIQHYRELGFNVINTLNGGQIGAIANGKWNKDNTYYCASLCHSTKEFAEKYPGAYNYALFRKLLRCYTWLNIRQPRNFWRDKQNCYNAAKKCKTLTEYGKRYSAASKYSRKMGWVNDYKWLKC